MSSTRAPQPPSNISLIDEPAALLSAMIKDLGNDVNKVKEEVAKYIQPSQSDVNSKSRILKTIAGNTDDGRNPFVSRSDNSWRLLVKEIPLGRRRRADMNDRYANHHVATRMDNSLLVTTRKFLELKNFDESVNLNDAAEALNVPKRRLYDITNVLEGIDLVEKIGKNSIRWKTNDGDAMLLKRLQFDCNSLRCEEVELDSVLLDLTSALKLVKEDPTYKPYGYLQLQDLQSLDIFSNQTLIAVKSLHEAQSFIEVADPSKTGKFQIKVRAGSHSPLRAFLCPSNAHSYSNIEAILSSGDLDRAECSSCDSIPLWASQVDSRVILSESDERKPPKINEGSGATDIVLPECDYPQDSLSDLFTPDKVVFQEASSYLSPLKTLLEQHDQFPNNKETEVPITPHASDLDPYNFPSSGLNLSDLFSCSDWELTH